MSACAVSAPRLLNGTPDVIVSSMTHDSHQVRVGSLFCCIKGEKFDGHDFGAAAVERGAVALLVQREIADISKEIPQIIVDEPRTCVGFAAAELYGNPSRHLSLVGITGTNGKTTTAHLLASILKASGMQTEVIGTLSGTFTTPEAADLQRNFSEMVAHGTRAVAMEVSSHALSLGRVNGTSFAACVFTNLGRDHLDFHGSEEHYFQTKARLFAHEFTSVGVVNADGGMVLARCQLIRKLVHIRKLVLRKKTQQTFHELQRYKLSMKRNYRMFQICAKRLCNKTGKVGCKLGPC